MDDRLTRRRSPPSTAGAELRTACVSHIAKMFTLSLEVTNIVIGGSTNLAGALFGTDVEPEPRPLLPFSVTFRCLAMSFSGCRVKSCGNVGLLNLWAPLFGRTV